MSTLGQIYRKGRAFLTASENENADRECKYLIMKVLPDITDTDFYFHDNRPVSPFEESEIEALLQKRSEGIPLQYLLGEWDFVDSTFRVGEGVLIPRPETEELFRFALTEAANRSEPVVYDLCSGSGCIGISIKKALPMSRVTLVEKSQDALSYLRENAENILGEEKPIIIEGDILDFAFFDCLEEADVIVSNPPYIKRSDLPFLQKEVQFEPAMALDGGEDGLIFYRALADFWANKLKSDGVMLLECGDEQAQDICGLFEEAGYYPEIKKDFAGIDRMIIIRRKHNDI